MAPAPSQGWRVKLLERKHAAGSHGNACSARSAQHADLPSMCHPAHLGAAQGLVVMQAQVAAEPHNARAAAAPGARPGAAIIGGGLAGGAQLAPSAGRGRAAVGRR